MNNRLTSVLLWTAAICSVGVLVCLIAATSFTDTSQELLHVEPRLIQLGELAQGVTVEKIITIKNNSHEDVITIQGIGKSCGCSDVRLSKNKLEPGEEATLAVAFHSEGRRGHTNAFLDLTYAVSKEGKSYSAVIKIDAKVIPDIEFEPSVLRFDAKSPEKQVKKVIFSPGNLKQFRLKGARTTHPAFTAKLLDDLRSVEVRFDPKEWIDGPISDVSIVVQNDGPNEPHIWVPLKVDMSDSSK